MTEELKTTIKEEVAKLPLQHQKALGSLDWTSITENIGSNYSLSAEEINNLEIEVLLVLIGIADPDLFESTIEHEIGLTAKEASKISGEILTKIFVPINDALAENTPQTTQMEKMDPAPAPAVATPAPDYSTTLQTIGKNNGLNISQMGEVEKVISGIVSGKIKAVDMTKALAKNLPEVPQDKLLALSSEINENILKTMRDKLQTETTTAPITSENDTHVLGLAGIEIIGENTPKPTPKPAQPVLSPRPPVAPEPKKETLPVVQGLELEGEIIHVPPAKAPTPTFAQKLGGSFQAPSIKTEHSTKNDSATAPTPKLYPKGQDPYRLPPV